MGRSRETFGKKEVRNKQLKKRKDKAQRKLERKDNVKSSFDDMLAWVDENGKICSEPPSVEDKTEVKVENIEISVPKGGIKTIDPIHKGRVNNYNDSKGFGFISDNQLNDSVFFHINDCVDEVRVGNKVEFETEKGAKGLKAINVKLI